MKVRFCRILFKRDQDKEEKNTLNIDTLIHDRLV